VRVCVCARARGCVRVRFRSVWEDILKVKSIQHFYCLCTKLVGMYIAYEEKLLVYLFCLQNKWDKNKSIVL